MKKITRHQMRENAFLLVFEKLFREEETVDEILNLAEECDCITVNENVEAMFRGVFENLSEIDVLIEKNLKNWKKERISKVSLAILRLGVYEILYDDIDNDIVASECVKLAETFAFDEDVSFVNGIIGSVVRGL